LRSGDIAVRGFSGARAPTEEILTRMTARNQWQDQALLEFRASQVLRGKHPF
jgi:hypothetical protein